MNYPSLNAIDRLQLTLLALNFKVFQGLIKKYYLHRQLYDPRVFNESHTYYFRNGKRLIKKCTAVIEKSGYPETSVDFALLINKLRDGHSYSRFGDGEYSIIMSKEDQQVYFDTATTEARERLLRVFREPADQHLIGIISEQTLVKRLTFANAVSKFKNTSATGLRSRMPLFSEYGEILLTLYGQLAQKSELVFEAGLFRNTNEQQHKTLWRDKDILYVTGSLQTSKDHGIDVHEMFDNARSLNIIETVTENALSKHYDEIIEKIVSFPEAKNKMILLSQGMAGTVLAYDLARQGFHAIDLGQPFVKYIGRRPAA